MSKDTVSISKKANNVLLKITVPKRTGRKRKRGSQEPYQMHEGDATNAKSVETSHATRFGSDENEHPGEERSADRPQGLDLDAKGLLRRLRDNVGKYQVEAVGKIERTNVFRGQRLPPNMKARY